MEQFYSYRTYIFLNTYTNMSLPGGLRAKSGQSICMTNENIFSVSDTIKCVLIPEEKNS